MSNTFLGVHTGFYKRVAGRLYLPQHAKPVCAPRNVFGFVHGSLSRIHNEFLRSLQGALQAVRPSFFQFTMLLSSQIPLFFLSPP